MDYCCQIVSPVGRVLEIFFETLEDATAHCVSSFESGQCAEAYVFNWPDMSVPVFEIFD